MSSEPETVVAAEVHLADVADAEQPAAARAARRHRVPWGYRIWLGLTAVLLGGVAGAAGWVLWSAPSKPAVPAREPAAGVTAQLPPAPPVAVALAAADEAGAAIAGDCRHALTKISQIAAALGPDFQGLESSLADAIALPEQRHAGQAVPLAAYQRWEVRLLPGTSMETYARGLDFFQIELGIVGGAKEIVYLSKFSQPKPEQREGPPRKDRRLYMTWQGSAAADHVIAGRAGIPLQDKIIAQFYPPEVEQRLAALEAAYAEEHGNKNVVKTIFAMKTAGEGFEFVVLNQQAGEP